MYFVTSCSDSSLFTRISTARRGKFLLQVSELETDEPDPVDPRLGVM